MAEQLSSEQMADLVLTTRRRIPRNKWTDLTTDLQEMIFLPMLFKQEVVEEDGSLGMGWNIMKSLGGSAKHVGLYGTDVTNVPDIMAQGHVDWRHSQASWSYDEREKRINAAGPEQLVNIMDARRANCQIQIAVLMEETGWKRPGPAADLTTPFGIPYWVPKWPTGTATPGFTGLNPIANDDSELTAGAGNVDSAVYARWANYAGQFSHMTEDDLLFKTKRAIRKTKFRSPISMPNYQRGEDRFGLYGTLAVIEGFEDIAIKRNDKLGRDVTVYMGEVLIHGRPIIWVPELDTLTGNVLYGINWSVMRIGFVRGENMNENGPYTSSENHRVKNHFFDCTWNTVNYDRRRAFVLSTHSSTNTAT